MPLHYSMQSDHMKTSCKMNKKKYFLQNFFFKYKKNNISTIMQTEKTQSKVVVVFQKARSCTAPLFKCIYSNKKKRT